MYISFPNATSAKRGVFSLSEVSGITVTTPDKFELCLSTTIQ